MSSFPRWPYRQWSLRSQVTVSLSVLVALVVSLAGLGVALRGEHRDGEDLNRSLAEQVEKVSADANKLLNDQRPDEPDNYGDLLAGTDSQVRLISGGQVLVERGARASSEVPVPDANGYTTVSIDGVRWRSLVRPVGDARPATQVQVLRSLADLDARWADNRRLVVTATLLAALLAAVATWIVAGRLLRPLERLRSAALRIRPSEPTTLPMPTGPREVVDLATTLNLMLQRLQASMAATRRFTGDAGHEMRTPLASLGMDLETLRANPSLSTEQRQQALDAMTHEHGRLVAVLDGLQALARGDAGVLPAREPIDLPDLLTDAVHAARRRYPDVTFELHQDADTEAIVDGWPAGLRLAVDNLLDNAARHGQPRGHVDLRLTIRDAAVTLTVADDGPGIPVSEREAMRERFTRGPSPRHDGSGLGLALVDQQTTLQQGSLRLGTSPAGGLLVTVQIPVADPNRQRTSGSDTAT